MLTKDAAVWCILNGYYRIVMITPLSKPSKSNPKKFKNKRKSSTLELAIAEKNPTERKLLPINRHFFKPI